MDGSKLDPLPPTSDQDYWEEAETYSQKPVDIPICGTHSQENWKLHVGYIGDGSGTITCQECPWGTQVPWYYRVRDGMIIDLRDP